MLFFKSINFLFIRKNIKRKTLNTNKSKEYDWLIIKKNYHNEHKKKETQQPKSIAPP